MSDTEILSLITYDTQNKTHEQLIDIIDTLAGRIEQGHIDTQDSIDDIANALDEFNTAYKTVSDDIDKDTTDEYTKELKTLIETIKEYTWILKHLKSPLWAF